VINTPSGRSARADGVEIRTATVAADKPLFTTIAQLGAAVGSLEARNGPVRVRSLQDYAADRAARVAAR
jgi:carbamoyl-phosphate synthase large subunit